jgi:hypothetical protein
MWHVGENTLPVRALVTVGIIPYSGRGCSLQLTQIGRSKPVPVLRSVLFLRIQILTRDEDISVEQVTDEGKNI